MNEHIFIKVVWDIFSQLFSFTFEGEVSVEFEILETTDFLKLHAVDLAVHNISLTAKDGNRMFKNFWKTENMINVYWMYEKAFF